MPQLVVTFARRTFYVIILVLAVSLAFNALTYINFDPHYGFLRLKEKAIATGWYLPFYYSHVLLGGLILLIGLFQIYPNSHKRFRKAHRVAGYVYVMGILFLSAPGGLVMSLFIGRGPFVLASFLLQSVLWFYFTAVAFNKIRQGKLREHQFYMWRSYALTFAAITLRVYIFFVSWSVDLSHASAYATLAWLSWVPNLLVAEWLIRKEKKIADRMNM